MGRRQQEKSEMTRHELFESMLKLFAQRGYHETSINDIAENAGYSPGSFYRHWRSKQDGLVDVWDDYVSEFIKQSVASLRDFTNKEEFIAFLIERANLFAESNVTQKLGPVIQAFYSSHVFTKINEYAKAYTDAIAEFLKRETGNTDEERLNGTAQIMVIILSAHASRNDDPTSAKRNIDYETLCSCLMAIIDTL